MEAQLFQTEVGVAIEGQEAFRADNGKLGWLIYGPYAKLEAGRYAVSFHVTPDRTAGGTFPSTCGRVDVAAKMGEVIAQATLYDTRLLNSPVITLPFELKEPEEGVEFRVLTTGRIPLIAQYPTFRKIEAGASWHQPAFPAEREPQSGLVRDNFVHFQSLYESGADLSEDTGEPTLSFGPIHFAIANMDDIQVVNEVLFANEYNFNCEGNSIFIDIGMNAALTSIQAAYKPDVTAGYAFEPFEVPYLRARQNIARNPIVADKIRTAKFGLSDENRTMQVNVSSETTIGTSVRGKDTGTPVTIEIRDAAEVLRDIILQAKKRSENVVMKVDCEGSEFPIMKRLDQADLLRHIDIFMIEWHKWWSPDMDQHTLMAPLLRNGFKVFDRTTPSNIYAGMLYAVRS